jgi:hypothetical protein
MAELSMNQIIHAAVRRDVARTEQALRRLGDGDGARARQVQAAWRNLVRELTHHHEAEDEILWPFLLERGIDAGLLHEMESEHVAMKEALGKKLRPASIVDAANALAWMQDGAGERERSALRATIPGPVVSLLTLLLARRYRREVAPAWR